MTVVAAYGVGSPLLWWLVTAAGVLLLIVSVFLLREPAGASAAREGADGTGAEEAAPGSGPQHEDPANGPGGGGAEHPAAPSS